MAQKPSTDGSGVSRTDAGWSLSPVGRVAAPLREKVLEAVRTGIFDHRLRPGQRLIERELMEQLGVSRATIREVIAQLASEGLITNIPQRGAIVNVLSYDEAADLYEMRVPLEALAARWCVERASEDEVVAFRRAVEELAGADTSDPEWISHLSMSEAFNNALLAGAHSTPLTQVLSTLLGRIRRLRWMSLTTPGRLKHTVAEIRAIVEAIEARDAKKASEATVIHIRNAAKIALARIKEMDEIELSSSLASTPVNTSTEQSPRK